LRYYTFVADDEIFLEYLKTDSAYMLLLDRFFFELSEGTFEVIITNYTLNSVFKKAKKHFNSLGESDPHEAAKRYTEWIKNLDYVKVVEPHSEIVNKADKIIQRYSLDKEDAITIATAHSIEAMSLFLKPKKEIIELKKVFNGLISFLSNVYYATGTGSQVGYWWEV